MLRVVLLPSKMKRRGLGWTLTWWVACAWPWFCKSNKTHGTQLRLLRILHDKVP